MKVDPAYFEISKRFHANPDQFADAFARAWFKLTHRDMGPKVRYVGPEVPEEDLIWQDPVPAVDHGLVSDADIAALKKEVLATGLDTGDLVRAAWASASTFRGSDARGGANGARIRLAPQKDWDVNAPATLAKVLTALEGVQKAFNARQTGATRVSLADLIVLAGSAAVEEAARRGGHDVTVPFAPGRTDATDAMTDADSFAVLEPTSDGFRNYLRNDRGMQPEELLVDRAQLLTLSAPEMTALVGGLRVIGGNQGGSSAGVLTDRPGTLSNDFFRNILDMGTEWSKSGPDGDVYVGRDRASGDTRWTATRVDLIFGSHSQLRALAEVYAGEGMEGGFVQAFVDAWAKVMHLDRFDLR